MSQNEDRNVITLANHKEKQSKKTNQNRKKTIVNDGKGWKTLANKSQLVLVLHDWLKKWSKFLKANRMA